MATTLTDKKSNFQFNTDFSTYTATGTCTLKEGKVVDINGTLNRKNAAVDSSAAVDYKGNPMPGTDDYIGNFNFNSYDNINVNINMNCKREMYKTCISGVDTIIAEVEAQGSSAI